MMTTDDELVCQEIANHRGWDLQSDGRMTTADGRAISAGSWPGFVSACTLQGWIAYRKQSGTTLPTGQYCPGIVIVWDRVREWCGER